jgi:hypothetical protein
MAICEEDNRDGSYLVRESASVEPKLQWKLRIHSGCRTAVISPAAANAEPIHPGLVAKIVNDIRLAANSQLFPLDAFVRNFAPAYELISHICSAAFSTSLN